MNWPGEFVRRLRMLLERRRFDAELEEEMRLHLEMREQEQLESGVAADEARAAARRRFGNTTYLREESRIAWGWDWLENAVHDIRYGARMLRKSPGFSAVVILTMALGIGATTAIFTVVNATLLRPLPYTQPEQLVSIVDDLPGVGARDVGMSQPELEDFKRSGIFEYVSPAWFDENNLTGSSQPARVRLLLVAPSYFALLGVRPQLGRAFDPADHSPGILPEILISDGLWKRAFGGEPNILEKSIRLDTDLYRIVGVMPAGFDAPGRTAQERNIEAWVASSFYGPPLPDQPLRSPRNLPTAIARIKHGLTMEQAQSRLDALVASLQKEYPGDYPGQNGWTVRLLPLKERVVGNVRQSLFLLFGAVGLVLLIACVNIANLLLARGSARAREMAVRQALGAGRKRLVSQLLTESLLFSLTGGIAGVTILFCTKGFLLRLVPNSLPRLNDIAMSWEVLVFALVATVVAGVVFGLTPALHVGRSDLTKALKEAARGSTGAGAQARTRRLLVATEFALSLVLMIAAGLLLRSFWDLLNVRLGFQPENVMTIRTRLPYPNDVKIDLYRTLAQKGQFFREVLRRVGSIPGVREAAMGDTAAIPLDQSQRELKLLGEGQLLVKFEGRDTQSDQATVVERSSVTPDYFHLMGIPVLSGRSFNNFDDEKTPPVALINEAMVQIYWPNECPLGKRFQSTRADSVWVTVVGIVANSKTQSLAQSNVPQIYLNLYQTGGKHLCLFLRGKLDPAAIPEDVRAQIQTVDPTLPVTDARMLNETVAASLAERRLSLEVVGMFALTALFLAGLGIYGVIAYMVSERRHEIGIRMALGAQRGNIVQMILGQGLSLAVAGAAIGLACALVISHLMTGVLYGVKPTDPLTFAGVPLFLLLVALFACFIPARRATRVDPMITLRHE